MSALEEKLNLSSTTIPLIQKNLSARFWPLIALLSGVSFSLHNEFLFTQSKETTITGLGVAVLLPYWIGELPLVTLYALYKFNSHMRQHGNVWSK